MLVKVGKSELVIYSTLLDLYSYRHIVSTYIDTQVIRALCLDGRASKFTASI